MVSKVEPDGEQFGPELTAEGLVEPFVILRFEIWDFVGVSSGSHTKKATGDREIGAL